VSGGFRTADWSLAEEPEAFDPNDREPAQGRGLQKNGQRKGCEDGRKQFAFLLCTEAPPIIRYYDRRLATNLQVMGHRKQQRDDEEYFDPASHQNKTTMS